MASHNSILELKRAWIAEWLAGCASIELVWMPSGELAGLVNNRLVWIV